MSDNRHRAPSRSASWPPSATRQSLPRRRRIAWLPLLLLLLGLPTACTPAPSETVAPPACPTLKVYSSAQQAEAAGELEALPAGAELRPMMDDYGALRAQVRACRAGA